MSSRRSRSRQSGVSRISDDQISDLVSKLQQLIPEVRSQRSDKVANVVFSLSNMQFVFVWPSFVIVDKSIILTPSSIFLWCNKLRCGTKHAPLYIDNMHQIINIAHLV